MGTSSLHAQTFKAFTEAADIAMEDKDYYSALSYYNNAIEFDENNMDIRYKRAKSAAAFNSYSLAAKEFEYVLNQDSTNTFPLASFELAQMQQQLGKYEEAKGNYELFISEYTGSDERKLAIARKEIESVNWSVDLMAKEQSGTSVERLGDQINTAYSEFGAIKLDNELYYSSLRFEDLSSEFDPNRSVGKILSSKDNLEGVVLETGEINNSQKTVAHSTFTPDRDQIYYTLCDYVSAQDLKCKLYYRNIDGEFYGDQMPLPNFINSDEYTATQPNIAFDKNSGKTRLYYVSDRPLADGTEHGLDIWYTELVDGGNFTEPVNVSDVNTKGNEITPFFHSSSSTLYFSSDADLRLGGFDIFKSIQKENGFGQRINLGAPINTSYNDVYYTLSDDNKEAHFSSNRLGSNYIDQLAEACCYDIYKADIQPTKVVLDALTFNKTTLDSLEGVTVRLLDAETEEIIDVVDNMTEINHLFNLESDREYLLFADKSGYGSDTIYFDTYNVIGEDTLIKKLYLEPQFIELEVLTFNRGTNEDLAGTTIIIEDMSDPDNPKIEKINLDGNNFTFQLERGKQYKVTAMKDGFEQSSIMVDTRDPEIGDKVIRKLYLTSEVISLTGVLPLTLYFDNDKPDENSIKMFTLRSYTETYYPYIARKDVFLRQKADQSSVLDVFFENDVKGGYTDLQQFLNALVNRLARGESYELEIKGYCSPKWTDQYNKALGLRRVFSVKNELRDHLNGVLTQYLDNGQLKLKDVTYGEELAPGGISDSQTNVKESIYSIEASKERKVIIVDINQINK